MGGLRERGKGLRGGLREASAPLHGRALAPGRLSLVRGSDQEAKTPGGVADDPSAINSSEAVAELVKPRFRKGEKG